MDNDTPASSWSDVLLKGVSAVIDSQAQKNFLANEAKYSTAGGVAGQAQATNLAQAISGSPLAVIGVVAAAVVILVLVFRR
jgi:predicted house-cleaning NTP pyrophosphatase (Maf/HAM1 superfamily)